MNHKDFIVPAKSRAEIRRIAAIVRNYANSPRGAFDITKFMEMVLPSLDPAYSLEICDVAEMGDDLGLTSPDRHIIRLREDVYEQALDGNGCARMTCAHELGHYIMHSERLLTFSRSFADDKTPRYMHSEWQANCFGGELLIPAADHDIIATSDVHAISSMYGVTLQAAEIQQRVCIGERPNPWQD